MIPLLKLLERAASPTADRTDRPTAGIS